MEICPTGEEQLKVGQKVTVMKLMVEKWGESKWSKTTRGHSRVPRGTLTYINELLGKNEYVCQCINCLHVEPEIVFM